MSKIIYTFELYNINPYPYENNFTFSFFCDFKPEFHA